MKNKFLVALTVVSFENIYAQTCREEIWKILNVKSAQIENVQKGVLKKLQPQVDPENVKELISKIKKAEENITESLDVDEKKELERLKSANEAHSGRLNRKERKRLEELNEMNQEKMTPKEYGELLSLDRRARMYDIVEFYRKNSLIFERNSKLSKNEFYNPRELERLKDIDDKYQTSYKVYEDAEKELDKYVKKEIHDSAIQNGTVVNEGSENYISLRDDLFEINIDERKFKEIDPSRPRYLNYSRNEAFRAIVKNNKGGEEYYLVAGSDRLSIEPNKEINLDLGEFNVPNTKFNLTMKTEQNITTGEIETKYQIRSDNPKGLLGTTYLPEKPGTFYQMFEELESQACPQQQSTEIEESVQSKSQVRSGSKQ